jgi:histidinol-phosphatase
VQRVFDRELAFAHGVADRAAEIGTRVFRGGFEVMTKPDRSPVTEADLAIEAMVREQVADTFPGDVVLGEEQGGNDAGGRTWIVDPIDATKNFALGIQIWATLLALRVEGDLKVAVVSAPALGERYAAIRGAGATLNGEPIRVSSVTELDRAHVLYAGMKTWLGEPRREAVLGLVAGAGRTRAFGDFWGHVLVARGAAEIMLEPELNVWDFAAPQLVTEEAGGRVTTLGGGPTVDGGSVLTTNGLLHDEVLERLSEG